MHWGGDDWGPIFTEDKVPLPETTRSHVSVPKNTTAAFEEERGGSFDEGTTKVKIKITKQQLEVLLGRVEMKEMTVHQVMVQLVGGDSEMHHHAWQPALQSIPEAN